MASNVGDNHLLIIDALLTPAELAVKPAIKHKTIAIVVDMIRATTTLTVMFDRGCTRVFVAGDVPQARAFVRQHPGMYLLAGEIGGLPPSGFDFGNSPADLEAANLLGREVVFSTTNGTRAIRACSGAGTILAGSLRNADAVCRFALSRVQSGKEVYKQQATSLENEDPEIETVTEAALKLEKAIPDIVIVCSGRDGRVALDDTWGAGALLADFKRLASEFGYILQMREGAQIAHMVYLNTASPADVFLHSDSGQAVIEVGLEADIAFCATLNTSQNVPVVIGSTSDDLLIIEPCAGYIEYPF